VKKIFRQTTVAAIMVSITVLIAGFILVAQEPARRAAAQSAAKASDTELRAFAKAYTEYQRIRREYEPKLKNTKDAATSKKIQDEANAKVAKALEEQHMSADEYRRLFNLINTDEALRKKVLALVAEERRKS
jgi:cell shape-determining protein MreC